MNEETRQLCQAVHQSTRRTVEETWPLEESAETLLAWTDAALNHVAGTVDGFRQVTQASVDCGMGCAFCCWRRIDVRAHEVFLILQQLRAQRTAEELQVLQGE